MSDQPGHVIVMGVTAVGKTSVADGLVEALGWDFMEGDDLHPQANIDKMSAGTPLTDEDRWPWLHAIAARIREEDEAGKSTITTCSALRRVYRDILREAVARDHAVYFLHLHAPFEVLKQRMAHRTRHFMPTSLLQSQFDTLEPLESDEAGIMIDVSPPQEAVVAASLEAIRLHYRL